jgi:hypothetical protein
MDRRRIEGRSCQWGVKGTDLCFCPFYSPSCREGVFSENEGPYIHVHGTYQKRARCLSLGAGGLVPFSENLLG